MTTDVDAQCLCWINQTIVIERIKEQKCQQKDNQKKVTKFKVIETSDHHNSEEL